jgi:hypothetical protein
MPITVPNFLFGLPWKLMEGRRDERKEKRDAAAEFLRELWKMLEGCGISKGGVRDRRRKTDDRGRMTTVGVE